MDYYSTGGKIKIFFDWCHLEYEVKWSNKSTIVSFAVYNLQSCI